MTPPADSPRTAAGLDALEWMDDPFFKDEMRTRILAIEAEAAPTGEGGLRGAATDLLAAMTQYEAGWMTSMTGYSEVAQIKQQVRAYLAAPQPASLNFDTLSAEERALVGNPEDYEIIRWPDAILAIETEAAGSEGLRAALDNLVVAVDALEARSIRSGGEFHVWAEERMVTEARDEARAALAATAPAPKGLADDPYAIPNHLIRQFQDAIEERDEVLAALTTIEVVAWKRAGEAVMSLTDVDKLIAVVEQARAIHSWPAVVEATTVEAIDRGEFPALAAQPAESGK